MSINELIKKFSRDRDHYLSANYNEAQLRSDFLDPLFELLGWDIKNKKQRRTNEREVILEEPLKASASENTKKPDYTFRLFSERKFFLEAKKPGIPIQKDEEAARQIRRYGFTGKLKISVLSNFEYLIIYDCSVKVEEEDNYDKARIKVYHYTEYEDKFGELKKFVGKETVYSGQFDEIWKDIEDKINRFSVDDLFLAHINDWRVLLGIEVNRYAPNISTEHLNDIVQSYLNSIIFLRVCEDRSLEEGETLLKFRKNRNIKGLIGKLREADKKYNSGLFQLPLSEKIIEKSSSIFWKIIAELYYPESPYSFSVFSSDILGNIYEIFLSEKLVPKEEVVLERKPETVDKDIVTTPTYIIHSILNQTIIPLCERKTDEDVLKIKIADISCGSGAFLLEAFQLLNDLLIDYYLKGDTSRLIRTGIDTYKLPFELKKKLLVNCIYGVDKDYNAVEATKFGLLLKLLENENSASVGTQIPVLSDLSKNIQFGNALVSSKALQHFNSKEQAVINSFDFKNFRYDIIIGNPPYMKSEDMKRITPLEHPVYKTLFESSYKQYDKYFLFIEKGLSLLNDNGYMGYIVPNKFCKVGAGKKLRHLLSTSGYLKRIISFGANQLFKSKTTYTNLLILKKSQNEACEFCEVKNLMEWKVKELSRQNIDFAEYPLSKLDDEVWVFVPPYLKNAFNIINTTGIPLIDLLGKNNIFNGIQTSRNWIYVINSLRIDSQYIYFENKGLPWKVEKELTRPYYQTPKGKNDDRLNTYRQLEPNSKVIFPYKKTSRGLEVIPESELQGKYPETYRYFNHFKTDLLKRDVKPPIGRDDWYKYGRSQSLDRWVWPVKIVIGVNSLGNKYSIDYNHTVISSGGTAGYCGITVPPDVGYSIYYIQALLNSKYLEWYSSLIGEVFRGGYIARGTKVLNRLPIRGIDFDNPDDKQLHDKIVDMQRKLIHRQSEIDKHSGDKRMLVTLNRQFGALKRELEAKLQELYGLGDDDGIIPLIKELYATH